MYNTFLTYVTASVNSVFTWFVNIFDAVGIPVVGLITSYYLIRLWIRFFSNDLSESRLGGKNSDYTSRSDTKKGDDSD